MWEKGTSVGQMTKDIEGQILKSDEEQRLVYGWASVITEKGEPVVDRQGDVIKPDTLVKAVSKFMEHVRVGKQMHDGEQIGVVVHSWPCTNEINKSVGLDADREGWLVAFKVYDDEVWADVKAGKLAAFSIGGRAIKGEYDGD
jgi:phage head maturation protease